MYLVTSGLGSTLLPTMGYGTYDAAPVITPPDLENEFLRTGFSDYVVDVQVIELSERTRLDLVYDVQFANYVKSASSAEVTQVEQIELTRPLVEEVIRVEVARPQRLRTLNES